MPRLLMVARDFAPTSHVSVERATKLAKYLPEFGWEPTVLTGRRPSAGLPSDPALEREVAGVPVIRARAPELTLFYGGQGAAGGGAPARRGAPRRGPLHPKSWLVPDSQVLWYPFAVHAAMAAARRGAWDVVASTSFPPTAHLVARRVARRLRIPYVADFRDSWTRYHRAPDRPAPLAALERRLEASVVAGADGVVAVDPAVVAHVLARLPAPVRPPLHVIQNGYDEADFRGATPAELPRLSLVHTGQLRRSPRFLWQALAHALRLRPELRGRVHVWQVGFVDAAAVADLGAPPEGVTVHTVPPVPQRVAIGYMLGADILLVDEFGTIMPSKTLQYLRAGRPILAFLDGGGVIRDVLGSMPGAHLVHRGEPARAGEIVVELASRPRGAPESPSPAVAAYSRREIARRFASVLDAARERWAVRHGQPVRRLSDPLTAEGARAMR
jgi:hypothetical protein